MEEIVNRNNDTSETNSIIDERQLRTISNSGLIDKVKEEERTVVKTLLSPNGDVAALFVTTNSENVVHGQIDNCDKIFFLDLKTQKYRYTDLPGNPSNFEEIWSKTGEYVVILTDASGPFVFLREDSLRSWINGSNNEWEKIGLDYVPAVYHEFLRWIDETKFAFWWGCCGDNYEATFELKSRKYEKIGPFEIKK